MGTIHMILGCGVEGRDFKQESDESDLYWENSCSGAGVEDEL